jgi:hypothetical protein
VNPNLIRHSEACALHDLLMDLPAYVVRLADIIDHAEQYDPWFVAHCYEAMRMAQQKIDRMQSPTFGPD